MTPHPVFPIAQEIISIFEKESIPYMIMGGLSVRFWALPRPTYDVDLTIRSNDTETTALILTLEKQGYVIPPETKKGWKDKLAGMKKFEVRKFMGTDSWRIDIFLVTTQYQESAFARRRKAKLLGKDVWTISPEDLILHKLIASRERDLVDVAEILQLSQGLDLPYLKKCADELGVAAALRERFKKTGLPPP